MSRGQVCSGNGPRPGCRTRTARRSKLAWASEELFPGRPGQGRSHTWLHPSDAHPPAWRAMRRLPGPPLPDLHPCPFSPERGRKQAESGRVRGFPARCLGVQNGGRKEERETAKKEVGDQVSVLGSSLRAWESPATRVSSRPHPGDPGKAGAGL